MTFTLRFARAKACALRRQGRRQGGFSLLELVIVLLITGVAVVVAARLIQSTTGAANADRENVGLQSAYRALVGFARANARLPASDGGWAPAQLSGNARGNRLRYHVAAAVTQPPSVVFSPSANFAINSPGLNFCLSLTRLSASSLIAAGQGGPAIPVLALMEHSSSGPTATSPGDVALPGSSAAALRSTQGRAARGISAAELFSALGCGDRLSRVAAAAKYVDVATDLLQLAKLNTAHWRNAITAGNARNTNAVLSGSRLNDWLWLLIVDAANLEVMHMGKLPWSLANEVPHLAVVAGYASSIAQVVLQADLVREQISRWSDTDLPALNASLAQAQAEEANYAAALEDAKRELARLAALGLTS
ncbi:prepilin-type N-terminal cleavage/methylation domain-containing protein [Pseudacidovorax intermedius]|uniref:prepilin-type N-terminal cleavage/methylation domain-containing protein n=1 Tax=Pseudacidovorax intermedius TaxID=433924 RepID=UPI0026F23985|nr:prepilin-type N-terminal cleavage/methylation domain-containing protein [Pseudacidovorax intermedius]